MSGRVRSLELVMAAALALSSAAFGSSTATLTVTGGETRRMDQSWDIGPLQVAISVSNYQFVETIYYGRYSTPASVASQIGGAFSRDYLQNGLCASAYGPTITFHLKNSATFGLVTISGSTNSFQLNGSGFGSYDWAPPSSSYTTLTTTVYMTGGRDAGTFYDSGTLSARVSGVTASVDWTEGSTPSSLATELASAIDTAASGLVAATASGGTVSLRSLDSGPAADMSVSASVTDTTTQYTPSSPSFTASTTNMSGGAITSGSPLYSFTIPDAGGYDKNGNLLTAIDTAMGQWNYTYDNLNRLVTATAPTAQPAGVSSYYAGINAGAGQQTWTYDAFGNRLTETWTSGGNTTATMPTSSSTSYTPASNQAVLSNGQTFTYDAAGNVTWDGANSYLYDAEGRLCAVDTRQNLASQNPGIFGYLYDAAGIRVAKARLSSLSCNFSTNGFFPASGGWTGTSWVLGPGGEQVTEYAVSGGASSWVHSNVFAAGALLATYHDTDTYFALNDWLGTKGRKPAREDASVGLPACRSATD